MMLRFLTLILSFLLLFGCKEPKEKENSSDLATEIERTNCINLVFEKDSILGAIRNHASEKISLSETINNYTNDLKSLDFNNCPEEFKSSFQNHIEAWLDIRKVTDKYPSLRGELHAIFADLEKSSDSTEFNILVKQIWATWEKVEESSK